ncbi:MAG TPA: SGNH/GDSL hydrolase family protein [Microbacterium sp.]|nr:SGNH/GDSL hydrolase family protein [Microbacterium sp.]
MSANAARKRMRFASRVGVLSVVTIGLVVGLAAAPAAAVPVATSSSSAASVGSSWSFLAQRSYVALGDSYTAGQGAPPYRSGPCLQSRYTSYPTIAATFSLYKLTANKACSGATVADTAAQLSGVSSKTARVTLTVGAIDAGSNAVLAACGADPTSAACQQAIVSAVQALSQLGPKLVGLYSTIAATLPNARVAVLNYPHLFEPGVDPLGDLFNTATDALNGVIQGSVAAVGDSRVVYVDVTQEFAGHGIGSRVPYIAYNPSNILATANFHPNALGNTFGYARALANDRVFSR